MSVHPAALVLADHIAFRYYAGNTTTAPARCECGEWRGQVCDHPAHLAEVLDRAGLLAAGPPPGCTCDHKFSGHADGCPSTDERADRRTT